jgi:carotenoid biosynthesis protein
VEVAAAKAEVGLAPARMAEADRVAWTSLWVLSVAVLASSVLHHGFPGVLNVPSNEGVPGADWLSLVLGDATAGAMSWLCFRHAAVHLGFYRAVLFLTGSFVFTGLEESLWILWGRFDPRLQGTYYFTKGALWFLETPASACLGWFLLAYSSVYIATLVFPRSSIVWRAALGGLLATNVDLWIDPVQTQPALRSWVWLSKKGLFIFSIPLTNFIGWFLLIFLFALVFERVPAMMERLGPARAAVRLFFQLFLLELAILVFFLVMAVIFGVAFPGTHNWTVWGL